MPAEPRKLTLTWHAPRNCWKKKLGGRIFYLATGKCRGKTDRKGYQTALREWQQIQANHVQASLVDDPIDDLPDTRFAIEFANYASLLKRLPPTPATAVDAANISGAIEQFLASRRREAEAGQITVASWDESRVKLAEFREFCNAKSITEFSQIDAAILEEYRACQLLAVTLPDDEPDKVSPTTAKKRLGTLRQFLSWAHRMGAVPTLPANVETLAKVKLAPPRPQFFSLEECRTLYAAATPRTQLYILLGLNLGFTQTDIASLTDSMVDWRTGIVTRERQKTGMPQLGRLWPLTLELLNEQRSFKKDGPLLLTQEGGPLLVNRIKADGVGRTQIDSIRLSFNRVLAKTGLNGERGFRHFRKTGADWIAERFQDFPHLTDLYLAHASAGMKRHYARQHFDLLFNATDALGTALIVEA